jgi:hypothetical protein
MPEAQAAEGRFCAGRREASESAFPLPEPRALRGTNLPPGTPGETDLEGNPLADTPGVNTAEAAWKDLWFYSNPIFVKVK